MIQRIGGHHDLIALTPPGITRAIAVDLEAEAVRIIQVEGLAHQVIGYARQGPSPLDQAPHRGPERGAGRDQNGDVKQTGRAAWARRGVRTGLQGHERAALRGAERHGCSSPRQFPEAEHVTVERQRPVETADAKGHRPDVRIIRKKCHRLNRIRLRPARHASGFGETGPRSQGSSRFGLRRDRP